MSFYDDKEVQKKLEIRLNRIEGQVRGINKMVANSRDCMEILNQITSVQSALKGVWKEVIRGHLQTCIKNKLADSTSNKALIDELVEHIEKMK